MPRKYLSGYEKRKKKKQVDELVESQKGAIDKFFSKSSNILVDSEQSNGALSDENVFLSDINNENVMPSEFTIVLPTDNVLPAENVENVLPTDSQSLPQI